MTREGAAKTPQLSIVVPTRNESGNVEALVSRLAAVLEGIEAEVVFVDDSDDDTFDVITRLSKEPRKGLVIQAIHRPEAGRTGLGSAAVDGLKAARAELMAVMDGDLQHPPELLREMLALLDREDLDLVIASRYVRGGSPRGLSGPARRFASAVSRRLVQLLFREARQTSDPLSGYFLCRRSAIEGLEFRPIGFKILLEILVCVPSAKVGDIPLAFDKRHAGRSNASAAQGVAFVRHLWSLVVHVPGSARIWKYGAVGVTGLALFIGLLLVGKGIGLGPFQSWALAFTVSLAFNWQINQVFTFADVANPFTPGRSRPVYLPVALIGGCLNLVVFTSLLGRDGLVLAGLAGAIAAMAWNYLVHRRLLRRSPRPRGMLGTGTVEQAILERTGRLVRGEAKMLPVDADEEVLAAAFAPIEGAPQELLRAAERRRPILVAEAPSHVAQPRHDVGLSAWMGIPVLEGRRYLGLVVFHRQGDPFTAEELSSTLRLLRSSSRDVVPPLQPLLVPDTEGAEPG
ncbi:MAG TPA: glycosyltransferase [Candidatus Solibacter sp.]|nr:glycosyltransferase [Candidatus Solibacter sp.]